MKKWRLWLLMIPVCILALYCFLCSLNYEVKVGSFANSSFIFGYFIFFIMCVDNLCVHLFSGFLGVFIDENKILLSNFFYLKDNDIMIKILKVISYVFISIYFSSLLSSINYRNYYGVVWDILAIIVTVFYILWFQALDKTKVCKKHN